MSKSTWTGALGATRGYGDWADAGNWSPAGVPGADSDVVISTGGADVSASIGTVKSITDSSPLFTNSNGLFFESAGTNRVVTFLNNSSFLFVDNVAGAGGTILNIGGTLTNSHHLVIGNATLSASDEVTAASLDNTGKIYLTGSSANQALLDVTGSAGFGTAGVLSGYARLAGDSAIEFESGEITSLAAGSHLGLVGNDAFLEDSTALGSNSALSRLASIGRGALFALHGGATVSTTGALVNDGNVYLDTIAGDGGSRLNIGGALTNSSTLGIGNATLSASVKVTTSSLSNAGKIRMTGSSAKQALLDVTGSAGFGTAGVLSGNVALAGNSAIEFASGEITSLHGYLDLNGTDAFIEDSSALGSNSALTGLGSIGAFATLDLENKAAVSTTGALVNDGSIYLDLNNGAGGSSLTLAGALTNGANLAIGNTILSAPDTVTAASLDNTGSGSIYLNGSSVNRALLDVTGGVGFGTAGVLTGRVELSGNSAIEFASGQINTLAAGATLFLSANNAFIEDNTAPGSNSALTGLASIGAEATFYLEKSASVSTTGALANDGAIEVDVSLASGNVGGSSLTLAGALTNSGYLGIGNNIALSESDNVTAASLDNTDGGRISLAGTGDNQALLDVTSGSAGFGTAGVLSGNVQLTGDSAIEFKGGQITSLAASAYLLLNGNSAFIEDSTALGSNSSLTGLTNVAGSLNLAEGAAVSTTGALLDSGSISLHFPQTEGSTLSIGGALTDTGTLDIYASDSVTAQSFVNSGRVDLTGNGPSLAALNVSGPTTNSGSISILNDTEELAGAVSGAGSFSLSTANLQFDSSVSAGQTINESGADALILEEAQSFAGTISGFGTGDTIDAANFLKTGTTFNFVENSAGTGGTLTLHDASLTANILMTGLYTNSDFTLAPDSGTGTLVKFV